MGPFYPNSGQMWLAGKARTGLANSVMRLYKSSLTPTVLTTLAELEAAEADYTGYAAKTIANFNAAFISALGGAIQCPVQQFQPTAPVLVTNDIGGAWIEDATGEVVSIIPLPEAKAMVADSDALPISEILRFGSGQ